MLRHGLPRYAAPLHTSLDVYTLHNSHVYLSDGFWKWLRITYVSSMLEITREAHHAWSLEVDILFSSPSTLIWE